MSASLVGSEMCIRDRPWSGPSRACRGHSPFLGRCPPAGPRFPPWSISVSYTHLTLPTICSV
eukprot:10723095-Alexandrium_andersonii.AAC.1